MGRGDAGGMKFSTYTAMMIWLCHLGAAVFLFLRGGALDLDVYYWAALLVIVSSFPYVGAILKRNFVAYEPIYLFMGVFMICHIVVMFLDIDEIDFDYGLWAYVMKVLIVGAFMFILGYGSTLGKELGSKLSPRIFYIPENMFKRLPAALYSMGWILRAIPMIIVRAMPEAKAILYAVQRLQGWYVTSLLMTNSIYVAIMIDAYMYFSAGSRGMRPSTRRKHLHRLIFFFVMEFMFAITATGMRENMLIPILLIVITFIKVRKRMPYIALALIAALFVSVIMPFMSVYRSERAELKFEQAIQYAYNSLYVEKEIEGGRIKSVKRLSAPIEMSVVSAGLREEGTKIKTYKNVLDYLSRYIPRFLWPDKPIVDYNLIGKKMGILNEADYRTSVSLTLVGSLILNHGFYGVVIALFLLGILLRSYWEWLVIRTGDNLFSFAVYFLVIYTWIRLDEFAICLHSNIAFFIYLYFIMRILRVSTAGKR